MVRHSTFERYYKRVVAKHDAAMQKVIRNQVNYGIEQYKNKGNYASLPTDELEAELKTIFVDGAYVWGKFIQKSLPKDVQKSEQQDTFYRIVNSFFSYYFMNKSVTQITDTTRNFMNKVIQDGISQGLGEDEIVRNLRNSEITDSRARLITRTETGRAMNTGAMLAAATSNFLMEKVWVSAQDNRTRRLPRDQYDHLHMNGKKVPFDGVFVVPSTETIDLMQYPSDAAGSAGNVCNCFLPNELSKVNPKHIKKIFRSFYNGNVITIKAANGASFTCTPNHPILTTKGWVEAGKLDNTYNLIHSDFINNNFCANFNVNDNPSTFEQMFYSFFNMGHIVRKPGVNMDFYGDGSTSNVDIVCTFSKLRDRAEIIQGRHDIIFKLSNFRKIILSCFSCKFKPSFNLFRSAIPHALISFINHRLSFFNSHFRSSIKHTFASIPMFNISFQKPIINNISGASKLDRKLFDTNTGIVQGYNFINGDNCSIISEISINHYNGFVYTFETINQMYDINSLVAKNCRCTVAFVPKRNDAGDLMRIDVNNPIQRNNIYRSIVLNNS